MKWAAVGQDLALWAGAFVMLMLGIGWLWAALMRRTEYYSRAMLGSANGLDHVMCKMQPQAIPGVSIVLPVKGCRSHSLNNWRTQLNLQYGRPPEVIFVLDSEYDPAYPVLQQLLQEDGGGHPNARILIAGLATSCSQKIHNQVAGIRAASPATQYILLLDDDVALHPSTLTSLVATMEAHPSAFMATGYPFDVPPPGACLASYCVLVYHLPLLIMFSIRQRTQFVWGGCMMLRAEGLRPDRVGLLQAWKDGGYSDDLTLAARCTQHGLGILVPSYAIFPQWLEKTTSWRTYWNYLRRQLYVLDTYATPHNRRVNYILMAAHCFASWAFVAGNLLALWHFGKAAVAVAVAPAGATGDDSRLPPGAPRPQLPAGVIAVLAAWTFSHCTLHYMTGQVLQLLHVLSPEGPPIRLRQYNWGKLWTALLLENFLVPIAITVMFWKPDITWSGVRYWRANGRIVRVEHEVGKGCPAGATTGVQGKRRRGSVGGTECHVALLTLDMVKSDKAS